MPSPRVRPASAADRDWVARVLSDAWASTTIVAHGVVYDAATLPALIAEDGSGRAGVLTYNTDETDLEVAILNAVRPGRGVGTALLRGAADIAHRAGAARLWLITTNDNVDALRFYQRRGFRLVEVRPGAVDQSRLTKPSIPLIGSYGIEIHDELELELRL